MTKLFAFLIIILCSNHFAYCSEFKFSLGAISFVRENIFLNGHSNEVRIFPSLSLQYKNIAFRGNRLEYSIIKNKIWDFSSSLSFEFNGGEKPEPGSVMFGMARRRNTLWANVSLARTFFWAYEVKMNLSHDILGEINAWRYSLSLKQKMRFGKSAFASIGVRANWLTETFSSYYYGVRAEEGNANRPAYFPMASLAVAPFIDVLYLLNRKWALFTLVKMDFWQDEISNSPIVRKKSSLMGFLSLSYQF